MKAERAAVQKILHGQLILARRECDVVVVEESHGTPNVQIVVYVTRAAGAALLFYLAPLTGSKPTS